MDKNCLLPPCAYQGGKQRVAFEIVDYIIAMVPKYMTYVVEVEL